MTKKENTNEAIVNTNEANEQIDINKETQAENTNNEANAQATSNENQFKADKTNVIINANKAKDDFAKKIESAEALKSAMTSAQKKSANALTTEFNALIASITKAKEAKTPLQLASASNSINAHIENLKTKYSKLVDSVNARVERKTEAEAAQKEREAKQQAAQKEKEEKKAQKEKEKQDKKQAIIDAHEAKFPRYMNIGGVIAKRLVDGEAFIINPETQETVTFEVTNGNYAEAIKKLSLAFYNSNIRLAFAFHYPKDTTCKRGAAGNENQPSIYENYNGTALPLSLSKFPFSLDFQVAVMPFIHNKNRICTMSIYTEFCACYPLDLVRDEKTLAFTIDKHEFELYILEYDNATINHDILTGYLMLHDKDVDTIEAAAQKENNETDNK